MEALAPSLLRMAMARARVHDERAAADGPAVDSWEMTSIHVPHTRFDGDGDGEVGDGTKLWIISDSASSNDQGRVLYVG